MLREHTTERPNDPIVPRSIAHADHDLDDPHERAREDRVPFDPGFPNRPRFTEYVAGLRARAAKGAADAIAALAFIDQCEAARRRCLAGKCRRRSGREFHYRGCLTIAAARGKSRLDHSEPERPRAAAAEIPL